jgi:hypothetical protein
MPPCFLSEIVEVVSPDAGSSRMPDAPGLPPADYTPRLQIGAGFLHAIEQ